MSSGATKDRAGTSILLMIGGVVALVALLYADTFAAMAMMWRESSHNHGFIVLPAAAYLVWRQRNRLAHAELAPWFWGVGVLAALGLLWMLARAVGVQVVEHAAAVALIPAAVATLLGVQVLRLILFPMLFLFAAVPFGDALTPYLMRITADVSGAMLRVIGVPVYREGQFMTLPGGVFEIADVCSGLRYLTSGVIIGLLFAYLTYRENWKRAAFVVAAGATFILVNGIRAFAVMFIASATELQYFAGREHIYFGWFLFAATTIGLFWFGARFRSDEPVPSAAGSAEGEPQPQGRTLPLILLLGVVLMATTARPFWDDLAAVWFVLLPVGTLLLWGAYKASVREPAAANAQARTVGVRQGRAVALVCVVATLLAAGPWLLRSSAFANSHPPQTVALPEIPGCDPAVDWLPTWRPQLADPDFSASGTYVCGGARVNVFVAGFADNVQGNELVHAGNRLWPAEWRGSIHMGKAAFRTDDGRERAVNEVELRGRGSQSLIWYWYSVGGRSATAPTAVKMLQALQLISRGRSDGSVYVLETELDSPARSRERLEGAARRVAEIPLLRVVSGESS
jgi:exosortase A